MLKRLTDSSHFYWPLICRSMLYPSFLRLWVQWFTWETEKNLLTVFMCNGIIQQVCAHLIQNMWISFSTHVSTHVYLCRISSDVKMISCTYTLRLWLKKTDFYNYLSKFRLVSYLKQVMTHCGNQRIKSIFTISFGFLSFSFPNRPILF